MGEGRSGSGRLQGMIRFGWGQNERSASDLGGKALLGKTLLRTGQACHVQPQAHQSTSEACCPHSPQPPATKAQPSFLPRCCCLPEEAPFLSTEPRRPDWEALGNDPRIKSW